MASEIYAALGMQNSPFPPGACKDFYYQTAASKRIIDELLYGIASRKGFMVLVGEVGLGKTSLLLQLLPLLEKEGTRTAWVFNTVLDKKELLTAIARDFGIKVPEAPHLAELLDTLHGFFLDTHRNGNNCAIIIDEAHMLSFQAMEVLRMLSNLELGGEKLVQILLAGQPELHQRLDTPELRQFRSRINLFHDLPPLTLEETGNYVNFKLSMSGSELKLEGGCLKLLWLASQGNFRMINLLMEKTLYAMVARGESHITRASLLEAVREVAAWDSGLARTLRNMRIRRGIAYIGGALAFGLILALLLLFWQPWEQRAPRQAAVPAQSTPAVVQQSPESETQKPGAEAKPEAAEEATAEAPAPEALPEPAVAAAPEAEERLPQRETEAPRTGGDLDNAAAPDVPSDSDLAMAAYDFLEPWGLRQELQEELYKAVQADDPGYFARMAAKTAGAKKERPVLVQLQNAPDDLPRHKSTSFHWQRFSEFGPVWLVLWRQPVHLEEYALDYRSRGVIRLQERLDLLGFYRLGIDGKVGPGTWRAVEQFQREHSLQPTGKPDAETLYLLFTTDKRARNPAPRPKPGTPATPPNTAPDRQTESDSGAAGQPEQPVTFGVN